MALILVPGIIAPLVGKLADRVPMRTMLLTGATLAMLALFALGLAPTLGLVTLAFLGFSLGLTLYGPVVVNGLMVKSYPGREARALAISMSASQHRCKGGVPIQSFFHSLLGDVLAERSHNFPSTPR